jgi:hypothetical protein
VLFVVWVEVLAVEQYIPCHVAQVGQVGCRRGQPRPNLPHFSRGEHLHTHTPSQVHVILVAKEPEPLDRLRQREVE